MQAPHTRYSIFLPTLTLWCEHITVADPDFFSPLVMYSGLGALGKRPREEHLRKGDFQTRNECCIWLTFWSFVSLTARHLFLSVLFERLCGEGGYRAR